MDVEEKYKLLKQLLKDNKKILIKKQLECKRKYHSYEILRIVTENMNNEYEFDEIVLTDYVTILNDKSILTININFELDIILLKYKNDIIGLSDVSGLYLEIYYELDFESDECDPEYPTNIIFSPEIEEYIDEIILFIQELVILSI